MRPPGASEDPRLLSLDLWHTLVYLEPEAEEAYMRAQVDLAASVLEQSTRRPGAPVTDDGVLRSAFEQVYAEAVVASQAGRSVTPSMQITEAGQRTGRSPDPRAYLQGLRGLVATTRFLPAPGAVTALTELREEGWGTAVVSNTVGEPGSALRPVLQRMGFEPLVDAYVFSDEEPWTKPAPEIFREAVGRAHASPERTVHVGDGWVDIEGARRAGLRAGVLYTGLQRYGRRYRELFLPEGWSEPVTPYRAASWVEVPGVVRSLVPGQRSG